MKRFFALAVLLACKSKDPIVADQDVQPAAPDENETFVNGFLDDIAASRFDAAYGKMAPTYRDAHTQDQFKAQVMASPYLSTPKHASIRRMQGDAVIAEGWLDTQSRGSYNLTGFLSKENGQKRVLVFAIAGVPVLQGVTKN